jgi:hypothetical protein
MTFANLGVAHPTVWVCRPDLVENPCVGDLEATVVERDASTRLEHFEPDAAPPVDCFYLYPTVAALPVDNAPLRADEPEVRTVRMEAARFGEACRIFAPAYQQYTIPAFTRPEGPGTKAVDTAYADVVSAWHDYLANDNSGRGVVLIGHAQGASLLARLLRDEIEKEPAQHRLLMSAILVGANITVPARRDVGGDFALTPACRSHDQVGCVVAYSAYDGGPSDEALFGRTGKNAAPFGRPVGAGSEVLCTNPAALGGGSAALHPYLATVRLGGDYLAGQPARTLPDRPSGFVTYPGLVTATCGSRDGAAWLEIDVEPSDGDTRSLPAPDQPPTWGLHALDVSLALGDLVTLVQRQSIAWASAKGRPGTSS